MNNSGGTITNEGTIINNWTITNSAEATFVNSNVFTINSLNNNNNANILLNNSGMLINNGTLTRNFGFINNNLGATISGTGTIDMLGANTNANPLLNEGNVAPGNSIGTLTINGNFENGNDGIFIAEVNDPGTPESDQVFIKNGTATLGGTLTVVNAGVINTNDTFTIIRGGTGAEAGLISGDFTTFNYPGDPTKWQETIVPGPPESYTLTYIGDQLLPIELLSFSGEQVEQGIQLTWSTATELDNDYMAVERSADGRVFDEIGRVPGKGTTYESQTYTFLDPAPVPDINYYRLRQVDFDGATEYHPVITVLNQMPARMQLNAFPNPVMEALRISYNTSASGNLRQAQLRLFDANGRLIQQRTVEGSGGVLVLSVENLPSGLYLLELSQNGQSEQQRFVKE